MAKVDSKIMVLVDPFLKDSRMTYCMARNCVNAQYDELDCKLKEIKIGEDGRCTSFKKIEA